MLGITICIFLFLIYLLWAHLKDSPERLLVKGSPSLTAAIYGEVVLTMGIIMGYLVFTIATL